MTRKKIVTNIKFEAGFSLVEVIVAFLIMTIALLGVLSAMTFAIKYNSGNAIRSQAQAVMQQQIEIMQSAKFNLIATDQILTGGTKSPTIISTADGNRFRVEITVDDDPETSGIQINSSKTLKEISVKVTPENASSNWQAIPITVIFRRVKGN